MADTDEHAQGGRSLLLLAGAALGLVALKRAASFVNSMSSFPPHRQPIDDPAFSSEANARFADELKRITIEERRARGESIDENDLLLLDMKLADLYTDSTRRFNDALQALERGATTLPASSRSNAQSTPRSTPCTSCKGAGFDACPRCMGRGREYTRDFFGQQTWIPCTRCGGVGTEV